MRQRSNGIAIAIALALMGAVVALLALAPVAGAKELRPPLGPFPPGFTRDEGLAVDPATGDLYAIDIEGPQRAVERFSPNGEPHVFSALGTNTIDGLLGPGGKPCGEEPASCDKTETIDVRGILGFNAQPREVQIAIAPPGAAAGTAGNLYVTNAQKDVIDVFAPSGEYLGHLTGYKAGPAAEGAETAFGEPCGVAVDAAGAIYVGDFGKDLVHKYEPTGNPPVNADSSANFPADNPCTLAAGVGPSDGFIFVNRWNNGALFKLDADTGEAQYGGEPIGTGHVTVAVDPDTGTVLVPHHTNYFNTSSPQGVEVKEYDASGGEATELNPVEVGAAAEGVAVAGEATPGGPRAFVSHAGSSQVALFGPYAPQPPQVLEEWATDVSFEEARLWASFIDEEEETTYHAEYLTQAEFEANGGSFEGPNAPTSIPVPEASVGEASVVSVQLVGLQPDTTYRYRFLATNPVGTSEGEAHAFSTTRFVPPGGTDICPNAVFRTGPSAFLPDCRAYEMVSPVDKNGGEIVKGNVAEASETGGYVQARPDGAKLTYTALAPFGEGNDLEAGVNLNQYIASRGGAGWGSEGVHQEVAGQGTDEVETFNGFRQFMAFTPDLCSSWLIDQQTPPPTEEGQEGFPNLYRRDNCEPGKGDLEALTDVPLPEGTGIGYVSNESVQGVSADGAHALFVADAELTAEVPEGSAAQLYDRFGGELHLVSVRPDGSGGDPVPGDGMGFASTNTSELGSGWAGGNLEGAVSADGARAYWSSGGLYLRLHPEQGIVAGEYAGGECAGGGVACTIAVSAGNAFFWAGSTDGSKALYTEGGTLYEFDLAREEAGEEGSVAIAGQVVGVAGASEDLSHVYFVSREALDPEAVAGAPNLYLYRGGGEPEYELIGELSEKDVGESEPGATVIPYNVAGPFPILRAVRVSADGARIAFNSRARLTGYDNTDTASGKAAVEVFTYQAGGELHCVSCNPSGARPQEVRELREPYLFPWDDGRFTGVPAAAWLPTWEQPTHASNAVSADGNRVFFNSHDELLPRDANGAMDVYEWEAPGTGSCSKASPTYFEGNGGCLYLISSGQSSYESEFWEASADGSDVFFTTESSLVPIDPGSIDLYDARVGGGYAYPTEPSECEGEACQTPPAPPEFPTPASSAYTGPANPPPAGRDCRKAGRRAGKLSRRAKRARRAAKRSRSTKRSRQLRRRSAGLAKRAKRASRSAKRCRRAARRAAR